MRNLLLSLLLLTLGKSQLFAQNCSINAGLSATICRTDVMTLNGTRSGLLRADSLCTWTQISGPLVTITSPNSLITTVSGYTSGTYTFKLNMKCLDGYDAEDTVSMIVPPLTIADAGRDTIYCPIPGLKLQGNALQNPGETALWSVVGLNMAGVVVANLSDPNSNITLNPANSGVTLLKWTIMNNNGCISSDTVSITNRGGISPVDAGPDQYLDNCFSTSTCAYLVASNGGEGFGGQTATWTFLSGPTVPTMSNTIGPKVKVCNLAQGTYTFRYTVVGPCVNGYDDVQVIVPPASQEVTVANPNPSGTNTLFCGIVNPITMQGNLPSYSGESVLWTQLQGPPVTITTPNSPSTTVTGITSAGTYCFNYKIVNSSSGCNTKNVICYTFDALGTLEAGPDQILPCNVTSTYIHPVTTGEGSLLFRIRSGPPGPFNYPTSYTKHNGISGMTAPGTYRVEVSYSFGDGCPAVFDYVDVTVSRPPTGANAGSNQSFACAATSTQLAGNNPSLTGAGIGKWSQISGPNNAKLLTPDNYICDVKGTIVGTYKFRWTISGGNECPDNFDDILVVIPDSSITRPNAGIDRVVCNNSPVTLTGNTVRADETAAWTAIPGGVTFSPNNTVPTPTVTGLAAGTTYTFIYTITNSCGLYSKDTVKITTTASTGPSQARAGNDQCLPAGTSSIRLNANTPTSGVGTWTQLSGPPCSIVNPSSSNTSVNTTSNGTYQFLWTISASGCTNSTGDTVMATISGSTTQANAGADIIVCSNTATLVGNTPTNGTGVWSQMAGDGGATLSAPANPTCIASRLLTGQYIYRWTISNGACPSTSDDVTLKISTPPSVADAGEDITICNTNTYLFNLNATPPTSGKGQWVLISGPTEATIANVALPNTAVYDITNGNYIFRWMVSGGPTCPVSTDDVNVNISLPSNAGRDQFLCNLNSTSLSANYGSNGTWTQVSGPPVNITQTPPGGRNASVTGLTGGQNYTFRFTMSAVFGCPSTTDEVTVYNGMIPLPDAGRDTSYCNASSFQLKGNAPKSGETGTWAVSSGPPGSFFFPNATTPNATLKGVQPGIYILTWTLSNGTCPNSDVIRIDNFATPSPANAGADKTVCSGAALLQGTMPAFGIGTWTQISGKPVSIGAINNPISTITGFDSAGVYKFLWTVSNGNACPVNRDTVKYIVPSAAKAGSDQFLCDQVSTVLTGEAPVAGTGTWTKVSGGNATIVSPNTPTTSITALSNGVYKFVWTIANPGGNCNSSDTVTVTNGIKANKADAGLDDTICGGSSIFLRGNAPSPGANGVWTFISGPVVPSFVSRANASTRVTGLQPGTYKFSWAISSSCDNSSDEVNITILQDADEANAGADQRVCATNTALHANAPTGTNRGLWTQYAGPNTATLSSAISPDVSISNLIPGTYRFLWKIYNDKCYHEDTVSITVNPEATVNAGNDFSMCSVINGITLSGASIGGAASTAYWTIISGGGTLSSTASTSTPNTVTYHPNGYAGYVVIRLSASDLCHTVSDDIVLTVKPSGLAYEAINDSVRTDPNTPIGITVLANDDLPETNTLKPCNQNTILIFPQHGSVETNTDGTITYTPITGFVGNDSFQYKICNSKTSINDSSCNSEGKDNAWVYISVEGCVIPNAFSPNGDGINDVFEIPCAQGDVEFSVYNRWGIEVYRSYHYMNDWDGKYNGSPLPDGTYYYLVKYLTVTNYTLEKEGFITLHR